MEAVLQTSFATCHAMNLPVLVIETVMILAHSCPVMMDLAATHHLDFRSVSLTAVSTMENAHEILSVEFNHVPALPVGKKGSVKTPVHRQHAKLDSAAQLSEGKASASQIAA